MEYIAKDIEAKWQEYWTLNNSFEPSDDYKKDKNIF